MTDLHMAFYEKGYNPNGERVSFNEIAKFASQMAITASSAEYCQSRDRFLNMIEHLRHQFEMIDIRLPPLGNEVRGNFGEAKNFDLANPQLDDYIESWEGKDPKPDYLKKFQGDDE
tara:strand:- start:1731 stop:2078 length:348 start_codon:yes stop_codon:yes gene_type:complete